MRFYARLNNFHKITLRYRFLKKWEKAMKAPKNTILATRLANMMIKIEEERLNEQIAKIKGTNS